MFGVFFPTVTGVMAGINMSGDLRAPSKDIPNGSLAAICTGTFLYLTFILFLGATCQRDALLNDFMMSAKVSVIREFIFLKYYLRGGIKNIEQFHLCCRDSPLSWALCVFDVFMPCSHVWNAESFAVYSQPKRVTSYQNFGTRGLFLMSK